MPRLEGAGIVLREFEQRDRPLVLSVVDDPLIPLVTSVPPEGGEAVAAAYIERQRSRLAEGVGYSFVIADGSTDEAVGQIGLWTRDAADGRVSIGYWVGPLFRRRGYAAAALGVLTSWASSLDGLHRLQLFVEPWNAGVLACCRGVRVRARRAAPRLATGGWNAEGHVRLRSPHHRGS